LRTKSAGLRSASAELFCWIIPLGAKIFLVFSKGLAPRRETFFCELLNSGTREAKREPASRARTRDDGGEVVQRHAAWLPLRGQGSQGRRAVDTLDRTREQPMCKPDAAPTRAGSGSGWFAELRLAVRTARQLTSALRGARRGRALTPDRMNRENGRNFTCRRRRCSPCKEVQLGALRRWLWLARKQDRFCGRPTRTSRSRRHHSCSPQSFSYLYLCLPWLPPA
jgi:hypothetical protein